MGIMNATNPHYDNFGRALVPPAERPFIPYQEQETVQETVWHNPTDKDVHLVLHVGTKPIYSPQMKEQWRRLPKGQLKELRTGHRTYIIRAHDRRSIPSEFDTAIQQTMCQEQDCESKPLYCRDRSHHHQVVGGFGPQLVNESVQFRPTVHSSLIEAYALEQEALARASEALLRKDIAAQSMAVAQAQVERAQALRAEREAGEAAAKAAEDKNAAVAAQHAPQAQHEKKGK